MDRREQKRQRRHHRRAKRSTQHTSPDQALRQLAVGLDEPHPLTFLAQVSGLWAVAQVPGALDDSLAAGDLVQSFIDIPARETTALLTALRVLSRDQLVAHRIQRALDQRPHRLPTWLTELDRVNVSRVTRQTEPFGDGNQYWVELQWPEGTTLSVGALLDANWGQAFKDLIALPVPISMVEDVIAAESTPEEGITFAPISPADARAAVLEAIAHSDLFHPPLETESWPSGRPLLEWALSHLPDGGAGLPEFDLEEPARRALVEAFMASPHTDGLADSAAETVDTLVWFAGFNCGDPLRWSPLKIDQLLTDWWLRKVSQPADDHRALPDILRAFVRFSADRSGLDAGHLGENLTAIDRLEPSFLAAIGTPQRNTALDLARAAAGLPLDAYDEDKFDGEWLDEDDFDDWDEANRAALMGILADMVGGDEALASLDDAPLPEEPFDESGIAPDILPAVRDALAAVEADITGRDLPAAPELLTAARRLVHRLAIGDPAPWRRRASAANTAFAIAYVLYDVNLLLRRGVRVKDLWAGFGITSTPTSRVDVFRRVADLLTGHGDATLMTSGARGRVLELRTSWADLLR